MKYTFEIMKEYEDAFRGISVYSVSEDKKLMVDFVALEELEDAQKEIDEAYQRGLDDAWEAARKIADMWTRIDNNEILAIFEITQRIGHSTIRSLFEKQTANEAMLKIEAYEEKQKAEDKIKVGDGVIVNRLRGVVTCVNGNLYTVMMYDGSCGHWCKRDLKKTGKHYDIDKILEEMKK